MEISVWEGSSQTESSKKEREGLDLDQDGTETCCGVRFEDGGTKKKTGGGIEGGRDKVVQIFIRRHQNGQD